MNSNQRTRILAVKFKLFCHLFADRLHVVTWNVATAEPPEDVAALLQLDVQPPTDLYVIG